MIDNQQIKLDSCPYNDKMGWIGGGLKHVILTMTFSSDNIDTRQPTFTLLHSHLILIFDDI